LLDSLHLYIVHFHHDLLSGIERSLKNKRLVPGGRFASGAQRLSTCFL